MNCVVVTDYDNLYEPGKVFDYIKAGKSLMK